MNKNVSEKTAAGCHVDDNLQMKEGGERKSVAFRIRHFVFHWLAFFGIFAGTTVCPFCGQPGCPAGAGSAALAGGFFALLTQNWRNFIVYIKNTFLGNKRSGNNESSHDSV